MTVPAPDIRLSSEFPTNADRTAGAFNPKAAGWANTSRQMAADMDAAAKSAQTNAIAANERAMAASQSAQDAEQSRQAAESARDRAEGAAVVVGRFDKLYLGSKSSFPTLDNEGDPLQIGAEFFHDVLKARYSWDGAQWLIGTNVTAGVTQINGEAGAVSLKTINGETITGEGNIVLPPPEAVLAPVNVTPADGAVDLVVASFTGSPYYSLYGKPQKAKQARINLTASFDDLVWDSGAILGPGVTVTGPPLDGLIPVSSSFYWQIRYQDSDGVWSEWSQATSCSTASQYLPTVPGEPYGGGYYAGKIKIGASTYIIIDGGKASEAQLQWKTESTSSPTSSFSDGWTNTNSINNATHPAAKHCRDYRGGGFDDWYLPARDEHELRYRNLKPNSTANSTGVRAGTGGGSQGENANSVPVGVAYTTSSPGQTLAAAFKVGGQQAMGTSVYWTSTSTVTSSAWGQDGDNGAQSEGHGKGDSNKIARPVRRILVPN